MTELAHSPEAFESVAKPSLRRLIRLVLDDLSSEFRMTVLLADVEEFTYREIADIMGCPIGTMMSR